MVESIVSGILANLLHDLIRLQRRPRTLPSSALGATPRVVVNAVRQSTHDADGQPRLISVPDGALAILPQLIRTSRYDVIYKLMEEVASLTSERSDSERGDLSYAGGVALRSTGRVAESIELLEWSKEIKTHTGDPVHRIDNSLASAHKRLGDLDLAMSHAYRSYAEAIRLRDAKSVSDTESGLGDIYRRAGDFVRSEQMQTRALRARVASGDSSLISQSVERLARLSYERGHLERARAYSLKSLSLLVGTGDARGTLSSLHAVRLCFADDPAVGPIVERALSVAQAVGEDVIL